VNGHVSFHLKSCFFLVEFFGVHITMLCFSSYTLYVSSKVENVHLSFFELPLVLELVP
jgi:hypothetical protein